MEEILTKIKEFRKKKGYSYETMAHELDTSAGAYRKIEMNQTKLTVERLFQIATILEAKVVDILGVNPNNIYNQDLKDNAVGHQEVQNLYQESKEKSEKIEQLYESRLADKDKMIEQLHKIIEKLG